MNKINKFLLGFLIPPFILIIGIIAGYVMTKMSQYTLGIFIIVLITISSVMLGLQVSQDE